MHVCQNARQKVLDLPCLNTDVYENKECKEMNRFQTKDLSEFTVLTCPLFLWSLANLRQAFYHESMSSQQQQSRM